MTQTAEVARALWRTAVGSAALAALPLVARDRRIAVFYGGARAGDAGGPLVKIRLLRERFPERWLGFSLLYLLSNALYLPQPTIDLIRRSGIPVVLNQNGVFYPAWYPVGWERENQRMAKVHAAASYVLYQSEFCRRSAGRFLGLRAGASEVLHNAVDTGRFSPSTEPAVGRAFAFLLTGKIMPIAAYRLTSAMEGLAAARRGGLDARLVVAGSLDPIVETDGRVAAERLGITAAVDFVGPYAHADAPAVYRSADAYILTKHNDPCPNVVLEALASGLPVLYSASGGVPELVGDEAGIGLAVPETFEGNPVPSPQAIAEGMARIMADRDSYAVAARRRAVEFFDVNLWLGRHLELFTKLLANAA